MAYKALYRKYRPDNFDCVVGQDSIVKTLKNIVKDGKISHAYLFSGPRGTGKTSVAKIFAKAINCLNNDNGMPCGQCAICKQFSSDQTNDIVEIDAASNNGVDEIRELKSKINFTPSSCKYKVYIIDEVHMLTIGAFNALLKTLEEPPQHVVFILATTEMHKLPLTIISRCQNFNFKKVSEEQMKIRLSFIIEQEKINIDEKAVSEIAKASDGGVRDAIGLLEQLFSYETGKITLSDVELLNSSISRDDLAEIIGSIYDSKVGDLFEKIDRLYSNGKDFVKIAEDAIIFLKDVLLYKKAKVYFKKNCTYNIGEYEKIINNMEEKRIYQFIDEFNCLIGNLKNSSHPKILFEITALKLIDSEKEINTDQSLIKEDNNKQSVNIIKETDQPIDKTDNIIYNDEVASGDGLSLLLPSVKASDYKKILINNTLALADKKLLAELNSKCSQLQTFLINKDHKNAANVLLDGKIVGVSDTNILYTYPYDSIVEKADDMINEIELLVSTIVGKKYRVINITIDDWSEIRPYYVKIMKENKTISIISEDDIALLKPIPKKKKKSKEIEDAISMFGEDLIELK